MLELFIPGHSTRLGLEHVSRSAPPLPDAIVCLCRYIVTCNMVDFFQVWCSAIYLRGMIRMFIYSIFMFGMLVHNITGVALPLCGLPCTICMCTYLYLFSLSLSHSLSLSFSLKVCGFLQVLQFPPPVRETFIISISPPRYDHSCCLGVKP